MKLSLHKHFEEKKQSKKKIYKTMNIELKAICKI